MARKNDHAPNNYFNETDPATLEELAGDLATQRLGELERGEPLSSFTANDLFNVHQYILQDVYPWSGQLRTEEVGAMGMAMCRSSYVPEMLNSVMKAIEKNPPSRTNKAEAIATLADHWGELTIVHPFRDGNSRTQRFFFDQMMRNAGWAIDWTHINADEVHAARYIAAATTDSQFLADAITPGVFPADEVDTGTLQATQGHRDNVKSAELFHEMRQFRHAHPGASFHEHHIEQVSPPPSTTGAAPAGYSVMVNPNASADKGQGFTSDFTPTTDNSIGRDTDAGLGD